MSCPNTKIFNHFNLPSNNSGKYSNVVMDTVIWSREDLLAKCTVLQCEQCAGNGVLNHSCKVYSTYILRFHTQSNWIQVEMAVKNEQMNERSQPRTSNSTQSPLWHFWAHMIDFICLTGTARHNPHENHLSLWSVGVQSFQHGGRNVGVLNSNRLHSELPHSCKWLATRALMHLPLIYLSSI